MKHLIRHTKSNEYFDHGQWTSDVAQAQQFGSHEAAIAIANQCGLQRVELVTLTGLDPSPTEALGLAILTETKRSLGTGNELPTTVRD